MISIPSPAARAIRSIRVAGGHRATRQAGAASASAARSASTSPRLPPRPFIFQFPAISFSVLIIRAFYAATGDKPSVGSTRAALRRWQIANGRLADGYLTADLADELIRRAN